MRLLIDADGCPVVNIAIEAARENGVECLLLCDSAHFFERDGAKTLVFEKGADSVDFALANIAARGDIVITQDYGLAAMCLARGAIVLNQDGLEYTNDNIGPMLERRHISRKIRRSGGRTKGPAKREARQDESFKASIGRIIERESERRKE
ncbi:MAG: YaiI/YqxD family protein [Christensenellales bacterium]|jgi:uncharacterized protein YaiI (UPF0178 family)